MPLFDPDYCENRCPVCTKARKGHRIAKILQRIEMIVTFGGCPWCRARQRKYGVRPDEPLPLPKDDLPQSTCPKNDSLPAAEEKPPKLRWYQPTPGHLLVILLVVEAVLLLSERFQWFAFNEKKGWAVMIAIASILATMVLMLLWLALALCFHWRFQFSLRLLLVFTVAVAVPFSWLAVEMKRAREQRKAVQAVIQLGGSVLYDYQKAKGGSWNVFDFKNSPPFPQWLRNVVGKDCFQTVVQVVLRKTAVTDDDLAILQTFSDLEALDLIDTQVTGSGLVHLKGMAKLKSLSIWNTPVDDHGLQHLSNLTELRVLVLDDTKVTDAGMVHLQGLISLEDWLGLYDTRITDESLRFFANFKKLKNINLLRTRVTEKGAKALKKELPQANISYTRDGENHAL